MLKKLFKGCIFLGCIIQSHAHAQVIDPAMVNQIKALPKAQQLALAREYGIDLTSMTRNNTESTFQLAQPGEALVQAESMHTQNLQNDIETPVELKRFGVDLFNQNVTTFAPTDNAQIPSDYRLGIGDELNIQLYGKDNQEFVLTVNREGLLNFPKLGAINVAGLTFEDASERIKEKVEAQYIGVDALISMGRLRAINIFMAGEVRVPGAYSVSSLTTVTQSLFQAGGVSDIGSLRSIQVKRNGVTLSSLDLYDLLLRGDTSGDIRLQSGDVVFVPTYKSIIEIKGEVKRPMLYETKGETIIEMIEVAGGFTNNAFSEQVTIVRNYKGALAKVFNMKLNTYASKSTLVQDGDRIEIFANSDRLVNTVKVSGAVSRPGNYGWFDGKRISDVISDLRRDLINTADLEYSLIVREKNSRMDIEIIQFNLIDAITNKQSEKDLILKDNDQIIVFESVSLTKLDKQKQEGAKALTENEELQQYRTQLANQATNYNPSNLNNSNSPYNVSLPNQVQYQKQLGLSPNGKDTMENAKEELAEQDFSRQTLLSPIIEKLRNQVRQGEPVQVVSISGAVKAPGEYPLGSNYTINDLVLAAGGLKDSAFLQSIEIRRINQQGNGKIDAQYFNADISSSEKITGILLQSRDHVNIRENADWNPTDTIELSGEVKFPGTYLINKGESLTSVLERAGGVTPESFLNGAVFTRESIAEQETERAKEFAQSVVRDFASSVLTEEDVKSTFDEISAVAVKLSQFQGQGRLLIDLTAAFSGNTDADINVVDGDKLFIPKKTNTVTVVGEVRRQGTHSFDSTLSLEDYIALSAGTSKRGDLDNIYVIKANGSVIMHEQSLVYFASKDTLLSSGDTIIVPVDGGYKNTIPLWRDVTQIIYQGTVAIAAIARL